MDKAIQLRSYKNYLDRLTSHVSNRQVLRDDKQTLNYRRTKKIQLFFMRVMAICIISGILCYIASMQA